MSSEETIPGIIKDTIDRYVNEGRPTGDFVRAVLTNDLRTAVMLADDSNLRSLKSIVGYCHWEIPGRCWGSHDTYIKWINK